MICTQLCSGAASGSFHRILFLIIRLFTCFVVVVVLVVAVVVVAVVVVVVVGT